MHPARISSCSSGASAEKTARSPSPTWRVAQIWTWAKKLGVFGNRTAYGMHASSREIADELVKKLAQVTLHEPEIVCGTTSAGFDEKRSATFDVKAGAFTSIPDAGAP